ncbi:hypothetical protein FGO68_gene12072 [Halteria grandinella]|uniref:Uncharacterized protein n=1 Tax=Halteria grandinella TaxID=5974 RepID=A0A8J8T781_HALGN|nr:hypothetical protein FGO68_gene12072 [Halteria grandinella]
MKQATNAQLQTINTNLYMNLKNLPISLNNSSIILKQYVIMEEKICPMSGNTRSYSCPAAQLYQQCSRLYIDLLINYSGTLIDIIYHVGNFINTTVAIFETIAVHQITSMPIFSYIVEKYTELPDFRIFIQNNQSGKSWKWYNLQQQSNFLYFYLLKLCHLFRDITCQFHCKIAKRYIALLKNQQLSLKFVKTCISILIR